MHRGRLATLACALLTVTVAFAGCTLPGGGNDDPEPPSTPKNTSLYASFQAVRQAQGPVLQPQLGPSDLRLKMLQPADPDRLPTTRSRLAVALYSTDGPTPIEDGAVEIEAKTVGGNPASGAQFGAALQSDAHGVYTANASFAPVGRWGIEFAGQQRGGQPAGFKTQGWAIPDDGRPPTTYDTLQAALDADGPTLEPNNPDEFEDTETFGESDVVDASYNESFDVPVQGPHARTIHVNASRTGTGTGSAEELNVSLLTPDGNVAASAQPPADGSDEIVHGPGDLTEGTWTLRVQGQMAGGDWQANVTVVHELNLKVLDPTDPQGVDAGPLPVSFAPYEREDPAPLGNVSVVTWIGTPGPDTPLTGAVPVADGQFAGFLEPTGSGPWTLHVEVDPGARTFDYAVEIGGG